MMDLITEPFAWLLRSLYLLTSNYGLSIILFAVVVRIIMLPFQMKSKRSSMRMSRLSPRLKELEKKFSGNQTKYQEEVSRLYKEEKINPMSGCIWNLIPFPILIGLLRVIRYPITTFMGLTQDQLQNIISRLEALGQYVHPEKPGAYFEMDIAYLVHRNFEAVKDVSSKLLNLDFNFLGMDLGKTPQWNFFLNVNWNNPSEWLPELGLFLIPLLGAAITYLQMHITQKSNPTPQVEGANMKGLTLTMPLMTLWLGYTLPGALGVYWMVGYIWAIPQEIISNKHYGKLLDAEESERNERIRLRDIELEKKRLETERLKAEGLTKPSKNTSKKKLQNVDKLKDEKKRAEENKSKSNVSPSQVGNRKYARGRAYDPDRFGKTELEQLGNSPDDEQEILNNSEDIDASGDNLYLSDNTEDENSDDEFNNEDDQ